MGRVPIPCKKCGTFLSGKARKRYDDEATPKDERGMCNGCLGIGYSGEVKSKSGRKYLWKKRK